MRNGILLLMILGLFCFGPLKFYAQDDSEIPPDTETEKKAEDKRASFAVRFNEKFDLVFARTFLFSSQMPDSVPVNSSRSGSTILGFGFNFTLNRRISIELQPGFNFHKLFFQQKDSKTFPTDSSAVEEKLRMVAFELPIGVRYTFARDNKNLDEKIASVEFGGFIGYTIGSSYKFSLKDQSGKAYFAKQRSVDGINSIRYGVYTSLVYKWFGIQWRYRLSDYFKSGNYTTGTLFPNGVADEGGKVYPPVAPMELGFLVLF